MIYPTDEERETYGPHEPSPGGRDEGIHVRKERKNDPDPDGMNFTLRVVCKRIRPADGKTVLPSTSIAELKSIEDWEIHNGTEWIPHGISGRYLVPTNEPMEMYAYLRREYPHNAR